MLLIVVVKFVDQIAGFPPGSQGQFLATQADPWFISRLFLSQSYEADVPSRGGYGGCSQRLSSRGGGRVISSRYRCHGNQSLMPQLQRSARDVAGGAVERTGRELSKDEAASRHPPHTDSIVHGSLSQPRTQLPGLHTREYGPSRVSVHALGLGAAPNAAPQERSENGRQGPALVLSTALWRPAPRSDTTCTSGNVFKTLFGHVIDRFDSINLTLVATEGRICVLPPSRDVIQITCTCIGVEGGGETHCGPDS
uniref:(California timema) hypothetical protein n=1 Tax=Timema californicum TaxID=61474 RepID=A0A7R9JHP2_TIMCA|nr:unnamed protein product [Timema californicum]